LGWECTRFLVGAASGREGSRYKPLRGQRPLLQGGHANRSLKEPQRGQIYLTVFFRSNKSVPFEKNPESL
jgi:hypothetical protein